MLRTVTLLLCLFAVLLQTAENDAPAPAPAPAPADTGPWSHYLKVGFFLNSVATSNAETSNDATIGSATDSATYTIDIDGRLKWEQGRQSLQEDLKLKFGRRYDNETKWQDNTDEINYDANYKYNLKTVHNYYVNVGFDTVFTGPEPEEKSFDPRTGKISTGYAFKKTNILPEKDSLETRVGVRVQRSWGENTTEDQRDTQTGIEWVTRYERNQTKQLDYFGQYELFSEFDDTSHITHLVTAGLNYKITPVFSIKLDLRAYYESEPEDADASVDSDTYDTWSMRQETKIGFTFAF